MAQPVVSARIASYCPIAPSKNAIQIAETKFNIPNFTRNHNRCIFSLKIDIIEGNMTAKNIGRSQEEEIIEQINKIVLLKIKTIVVRGLNESDIPEFEQVVKKQDLDLLLAFAQKKVPDLSSKIHEEMKLLGQKIAGKNYA
jgi:hypothetical protein